jgi:Fe2+ transport system protein B
MVSTRTLDKSDDRKITTMILPFVSCGAKAPIYGVFAGALCWQRLVSRRLLDVFAWDFGRVVFRVVVQEDDFERRDPRTT